MKNHEYIRSLRVKDLAPFLISEHTIPDYDETFDGDYYQCGEIVEYILPDGSKTYSYEDAVKYTIDWLNAERKEGEG